MAAQPAVERLSAIVEMSKPLRPPDEPSWIEGLAAVTAFLGVVVWPLVVLVALILLREPLAGLVIAIGRWVENVRVTRNTDGTWILDQQRDAILSEAASNVPPAPAEEAAPQPDPRPNGAPEPPATDAAAEAEGRLRMALDVPGTEDVNRAAQLQLIGRTPGGGLSMYDRALDLAREYEQVRGSMAPSPERTRAMERVVAQMRAISLAVYDRRREFMDDRRSPGRRLLAVVCLQMKPCYEELGWLVERLTEERPFVSYHAAVALVAAAQGPQARTNAGALRAALARLEGPGAPSFAPSSDRMREIERFKALVRSLAA